MDAEGFKDKYGPVALVTGASSGIGKAFAADLAAKGLDLVLVARRIAMLEALAARLEAENGVKVRVLPADLADPTAPKTILAATADDDIGLIVSNAGFGFKGDHAGIDPQGLTNMLMVNCHAPLLLANGFTPRLRKRGKGGIIFTSSVEALMGMPYSAGYSGSKALVNGFGEALWAELHSDNIDVLTVCPGATESEAAARQGMDLSKLQDVMKAEEVARLTLDNIANGPIFFSSEIYKAKIEGMAAMPRRETLLAIAGAMKPAK